MAAYTSSIEVWTRSWRAWVLIRVAGDADRTAVADAILELNTKLDIANEGFIVRADEVSDDNGQFDISVPIEAPTEDHRQALIEMIFGVSGIEVESSTVLRVESHHPDKPHKTNGYVPHGEINPSVGILKENAWG